jgi:hypothetical protein
MIMSETKQNTRDTAVTDRDRVQVTTTLVGCCIVLASLVIFNAFPERIGLLISADNPASFVPLAPEFFREILPRLNAWWGLTLALAAVNLYYGRWTPGARIADLALTLFGIFIFVKVIATPLFAQHGAWLPADLAALTMPEQFLPVLTWLVKGVLGMAILGSLVSLVPKLRTLAHSWVPATA